MSDLKVCLLRVGSCLLEQAMLSYYKWRKKVSSLLVVLDYFYQVEGVQHFTVVCSVNSLWYENDFLNLM